MSDQDNIDERLNRILEIGNAQIQQFKQLHSQETPRLDIEYRITSLEYFDSILKGVLLHYKMAPQRALRHLLNINFSVKGILQDVELWLLRYQERNEYNSKIASLESVFLRMHSKSEELDTILISIHTKSIEDAQKKTKNEVLDFRTHPHKKLG